MKEVEKAGGRGRDETIFFRSEEPIKAVCLRYQDLSAEKEGSGGPPQRMLEWHGWRRVSLADRAGGRERRGRGEAGGEVVSVVLGQPQWMWLAVEAVLVLPVWLAASADMDRRGGTGGLQRSQTATRVNK